MKDACPVNCRCDEPKDRGTQSISLASLEQVEIEGVEGEDHEFDFLKVIFRCAPVLKRVTVRSSRLVHKNKQYRQGISCCGMQH